MASISSNMMMWRPLLIPSLFSSSSASSNKRRMLASDSPTYLFRIWGPFTILGSLPLSIFPICRAIRVLPVPGGPYSKMPRTCFRLSCSMTSGGNTREANALLKMALNSLSSPPMPILLKSQSGLMMDWRTILPLAEPVRPIAAPSAFSNTTPASGKSSPILVVLGFPWGLVASPFR
uniref:Uncharacterized protein n=1 Tax=Ixodes ricinus TaxID=34613 RepID=A0A6B0UZ02_IXORI